MEMPPINTDKRVRNNHNTNEAVAHNKVLEHNNKDCNKALNNTDSYSHHKPQGHHLKLHHQQKEQPTNRRLHAHDGGVVQKQALKLSMLPKIRLIESF